MGSNTLPASHCGQNAFAPRNHLPDWKIAHELFVKRVCPLSHRFCWEFPFFTCAWCYSMHRAACWRNQVWPVPTQTKSVSPWPTHPCLCCGVGTCCLALPCSHFGCCDFGGGATVWNWDKVKGNKGLWFQRVSMSQLISHVRKAVLRK